MTTQPPTVATSAAMPSQDDRLLAAFAHLSFLTGFWLIAPIVIYFIKRKESRFVAFHALQAVFVQIVWTMMMTGGAFALMVLMIAAGIGGPRELAPLIAFVPILGLLGGGLLLFGLHGLGAYWAWCGLDGSLPIAGRIARAVQRADEGAARV